MTLTNLHPFFSKENFLAYKMREQRRANPLNAGSKEIPEGEPFCLQGLRFAFTGDLQALSREQATDLIRKYGGWDSVFLCCCFALFSSPEPFVTMRVAR